MKEPRVYNGIERPEFTPERISELRPDEVFVFGSNLEGMHGGGAAWVAFQKFGAVLGCGVGLRGQSYAIPTMQGGVETIKPYTDEFVSFAAAHPELFFYVTRIGLRNSRLQGEGDRSPIRRCCPLGKCVFAGGVCKAVDRKVVRGGL